MKRFQKATTGVLYALLGVVTEPIADAWNRTVAPKYNYWLMRNMNKRYCVFRYSIDPFKPTWERVV